MVASRSGGYFRSRLSVRPGSGGMKPFLSAVVSVDRAGENSAAWWNATMSAGVHELPIAGLAEAAKRGLSSGGALGFGVPIGLVGWHGR